MNSDRVGAVQAYVDLFDGNPYYHATSRSMRMGFRGYPLAAAGEQSSHHCDLETFPPLVMMRRRPRARATLPRRMAESMPNFCRGGSCLRYA